MNCHRVRTECVERKGKNKMDNLWWGYIHTNKSVHVKRFFSDLDIEEAHESPFVAEVYGPWECKGREEALKKMKEIIEKTEG